MAITVVNMMTTHGILGICKALKMKFTVAMTATCATVMALKQQRRDSCGAGSAFLGLW
jgi:hypothetical protein